eukprot:m.38166 g.38166  ORF g.38166 m.38166 type:complete len:126 (-) comp16423_c0_seq2:45-422(-)
MLNNLDINNSGFLLDALIAILRVGVQRDGSNRFADQIERETIEVLFSSEVEDVVNKAHRIIHLYLSDEPPAWTITNHALLPPAAKFYFTFLVWCIRRIETHLPLPAEMIWHVLGFVLLHELQLGE